MLIGSFMVETNPLTQLRVDLDSFKRNELCFDEEILDKYQNTNTEICGFINVLRKHKAKIIPSMSNSIFCGGIITSKTFSYLKDELIERIKSSGNLQGILLAFHGLVITEDTEDAEGDLLEEIRSIVGEGTYIVCTLDFHATVTAKMVRYANILVGYDTTPHVDQFETGKRAAEILISLINKKLSTCTVMKKLPMLPHGDTMITNKEPLATLMKKVKAAREKDGIISSSIFVSWSILDIKEVGPSVVVSSNCKKELAQKEALYLARQFWNLREHFLIKHIPINEALDQANKISGGPVLLINAADSLAAGAPGDTTCALKALIEKGVENAALAIIVDPEAVKKAINAGVGKEVSLKIGGKLDPINSHPLKVKGIVKLISDGKFIYKGPLYTGTNAYMGITVVLKIDGIDVIITEYPSLTFDPELLRSNGIEPKDKKIIVLKDGVHFRAAYEPIAKGIFFIDCPGFSDVDFSKLNFKNIPRPIFPLDKKVKFF